MNLPLRMGTQSKSLEFTPDKLRDGQKHLSRGQVAKTLEEGPHHTPLCRHESGQWAGACLADRRTSFRPLLNRNPPCDLMQVLFPPQISMSPSKP